MSEIGISGYPFLQGGNETEHDYSVATTFGDIDIIVFNKIPKRQYGLIESWIEEIIEHETIHILLHKLEEESHHQLDNFFPFINTLSRFQQNPVRFIRLWKKENKKA